jgi:hypothetical protein
MSNISTIFAGVKTAVTASVGVDFAVLSHVADLEKNTFTGAEKRWGLIPAAASEVAGNTSANTVSQGFRLILTDGFVTSEYGDSAVIDKSVELMGRLEAVYRHIILTKAGAPTVVKFIGNFAVSEVMVWWDRKILVVEATFDVHSQTRI